jgi:hypothetical protein
MEHFTPVSASIGGVLIGLSATMLWLANGRIAWDQRDRGRFVDAPDK